MKSTVYCYDRHATFKRFGAAAVLLAGAAALLALSNAMAKAAPTVMKIERLPTVVIVGKSVKPVRLPTVVVEGRRQQAVTMMAADGQRDTGMKRVAYAPPATRY